jgi:hypothetical protein
VVSRCANPSCSKLFRYFHEGKLFRLERAQPNGRAQALSGEWFWLCGQCASVVTLAVDGGKVIVRPSPRGPEPSLRAEGSLCLRQAS